MHHCRNPLVCHDVATALTGTAYSPRQMDRFHRGNEMLGVGFLAWRQRKRQRPAMSVADHVDLGGQAATAASQRMVYGFFRSPFLPPSEAARVARIDVESIIQVSRSINPSSRSLRWSRSRTASKVPSSRHLRNRSYTVVQGPYI